MEDDEEFIDSVAEFLQHGYTQEDMWFFNEIEKVHGEKVVLAIERKIRSLNSSKGGGLWLRSVGADKENIVSGVQKLIDSKELYKRMSKAHNPYGSGQAGKIIIDFIKN